MTTTQMMRQSPLKHNPKRTPGQSIRDLSRKRLLGDLKPALMTIGLLTFASGMAAGIAVRNIDLTLAIALTATLFIIACIAALWVNRRLDANIAQSANDRLGLLGEQYVAEILDKLNLEGYHVFHDLSFGDGCGNCDHVVIGRAGIFVIETKTRSKRGGIQQEVTVTRDGRVLVDGHEPDRNPLEQARLIATHVRSLLAAETALKAFHVWPVVIFPGWYINDGQWPRQRRDAWVLNETAFPKFLQKEPNRLRPDDVALFASRISCRVRIADSACSQS